MSALEWLRMLEATAGGYGTLIDECAGSLAVAAHVLAAARVEARGYTRAVPTEAELYGAAQEIAARTALTAPHVTASALASECRAAGLEVM